MFGVVRRNPQFKKLWLAQVVSQAGDWLNRMAVLALIGRLSDPTAQVGMGALFALELVLRMMPIAVFGPLAGPVADRLPRRLVMVTSDLLRAGVVLGFLLVDSEGELPILYGLLLLQMSLGIFFDSARSASVPNTVPKDELHEAYTLSAATWSAMLAIGAFLGGVLLELVGLASVFVIDAGTYLVSAALLIGLRLPPTPVHPERFRWRDVVLLVEIRRAFRHVRDVGVLPAIATKTFWGMAGGYLVLLSVIGTQRFGGGAGEGGAAADVAKAGLAISLLYCARGLGTGIGPVLARRWFGSSDRALRRNIVAGFMIAALGYAPVAIAESLPVAFVCVLLAHTGGSTIWVSSTTFWQRRIDDAFRGRVFSLEFLCMTTSMSTFGVLIAWIVDTTGSIEIAVWTTSGLAVVSGTVWAFYSRSLVADGSILRSSASKAS